MAGDASATNVVEGLAVGIDLGTTASVTYAINKTAQPLCVTTASGRRQVLSAVAYGPQKPIAIGQPALDKKKRHDVAKYSIIEQSKTLMGLRSDDITPAERERNKGVYAVPIEYPAGSSPVFVVKHENIELHKRPEEIASQILSNIRSNIHRVYPETEGKTIPCVITVPARFTNPQRNATKDAASIAGFEVKRMINEPTAAIMEAVTSGVIPKPTNDDGITVITFDFGGGTFDVSLANVCEGNLIEILRTDGDTFLGGHNVTSEVAKQLIHEFVKMLKSQGESITFDEVWNDTLARTKFLDHAEDAKRHINTENNQHQIEISSVYKGHNFPPGDDGECYEYTPTHFKKAFAPILDRLMALFHQLLNHKSDPKRPDELDYILLVGGSCRIKMIHETLVQQFGTKKVINSLNLDEVVAMGACSCCANIVIPDMIDDSNKQLILDVTPCSVGIETNGESMTTMIPAGTKIPTSKTQTFTNGATNQPMASVNVLEGESPISASNHQIANFDVEISPGPKGSAQIEITYHIDENSVLTVTAKDKVKNKESKVTVSSSTRLSPDELKKLKAENEKNKKQDEQRAAMLHKKNDCINTAESILEQLESHKDHPDYDAVKQNLDSVIAEAKAHNANSVLSLKDSFFDELKDKVMKDERVQKIMSTAAAPNGAPNGFPSAADAGPEVEEAQ
jgi:molecular chaperone DnaK